MYPGTAVALCSDGDQVSVAAMPFAPEVPPRQARRGGGSASIDAIGLPGDRADRRGAGSGPEVGDHRAGTCLLATTSTSTRRFFWRPSLVALSATGSRAPLPLVLIRFGSIPLLTR